ncbi:hypothetical protein [Pseudolabrys sp.]|uniref:hypothetical protein n=1 Tax=Pseudolabrys sp. TaxID=1960880 RepID=UPI003D12AD19
MNTVFCPANKTPPRSWKQKLNPIWWMQNDEGMADWYRPDDPAWKRRLLWWLRNPAMNFKRYVIGFEDRDHYVTGRASTTITQSPLIVMRRDWGETGWHWCVSRVGWFWLPFASYSGIAVEWHCGWQCWGRLGAKFVILRSPFQGW